MPQEGREAPLHPSCGDRMRKVLIGFLVLGVVILTAWNVIVSFGPCTQIEKACHRAGFASGFGMGPDCIRPIMTATPQQQQATKPLPQIDPQVVAACKQQDPNFGKDS